MGFAKRQHGAVAAETAIARARKAWRGEVVVIRGALRERGVHGPLDVLDNAAKAHGYTQAPTQLTRLALELRDAGCDAAEVRERLHGIADVIVALTFTPGPAA